MRFVLDIPSTPYLAVADPNSAGWRTLLEAEPNHGNSTSPAASLPHYSSRDKQVPVGRRE